MLKEEAKREADEVIDELREQKEAGRISPLPANCVRCGRQMSDFPALSDHELICIDCRRINDAIKAGELPEGAVLLPGIQDPSRFREFHQAVWMIIQNLRKITVVPESRIDFKVAGASIWQQIVALDQFLKASQEHSEIISALQRVVCSEWECEFSQIKADNLLRAFEELVPALGTLSEKELERFYTELEKGGFDLNYPMRFWVSPQSASD